jgi:large subunit ribosomal protein L15
VRANDLPPVPGSVHKKKRLGRGNASGHGTYSGRGIKGQKSRSGPDLRIGFEGGQIPLVRALSRKRGFTNARFRIEYEPINVSQLNKLPAGSSVTPESLRAAGIAKSRLLPVKVLGDGELSVALNVDVDKVSASAKAKIEAAGGTAVSRIVGKAVAEEPVVETASAVSEPVAAAEAPPAPEAPATSETAEAETKAPRTRRTRAKASGEGEEAEA